MYTIAICDDNHVICERIDILVSEILELIEEDIKTEIFYSGENLLDEIKKEKYFDIILLDIEMAEINGVEVGRLLRGKYENDTSLIIYISNHEKYYRELFDVQPYSFIKKPIDKEEFKIKIIHAIEKIMNINDFFEIKYNRQYYKLKLKNISYIESLGKKVVIHTQDIDYECYMNVKDIEQEIKSSSFVRCHRAFIVNLDHAYKININEIQMYSGETIPISEKKREYFKKCYINYVLGKK